MSCKPTLLAPLALALCLSAPALAQPDGVAPLADQLLWCGSAMFWLAGDAEEDGKAEDMETFDGWSEALTGAGVTLLEEAGMEGDAIAALIDDYDVEVLEQMAQETMRYDPLACFSLIEPVEEPPAQEAT